MATKLAVLPVWGVLIPQNRPEIAAEIRDLSIYIKYLLVVAVHPVCCEPVSAQFPCLTGKEQENWTKSAGFDKFGRIYTRVSNGLHAVSL
jgi:hypothetical protein